jgi:hypothetical protein
MGIRLCANQDVFHHPKLFISLASTYTCRMSGRLAGRGAIPAASAISSTIKATNSSNCTCDYKCNGMSPEISSNDSSSMVTHGLIALD